MRQKNPPLTGQDINKHYEHESSLLRISTFDQGSHGDTGIKYVQHVIQISSVKTDVDYRSQNKKVSVSVIQVQDVFSHRLAEILYQLLNAITLTGSLKTALSVPF